ncbi:unnamed protein product [Eruca vesicaria subsp. sativa]|uniref:H/ACA ribonucleoprotein complex non-core subunit NAF1 n=1 Tax=Eruca vesicaria subsp. sativa TaxID=29727 RepID=A0ABC8IV61_ERUVS|nr:unnamed protein product [Eruca vesicaria subsp. sativa]
MEIGQEGGVTVSEETRMELDQNTVMSESIEVTSKLCGEVSSIRSELMTDVKPKIYGGRPEGIGASSVITEVKPKLCGGMSANFDGAVKESEPVVSKPVEDPTGSVACLTMNLDEPELKKTDLGLASSIEVGLEMVNLTVDDEEKGETSSAESESETSSSSSTSSASSSSEDESDEEESNKEKKFEDQMAMGRDMEGELEEGEIQSVDEEHEVEEYDDDEDEVDEMVAWSYDEDDEDLGCQTKEPTRTKNELKELPPVPPVDVTLEPHHVTLPLGVVLSVMSTQVIVGGMEKHSPLAEGSILWITERRTPLGLVDEIFGQVECPFYSVRFNSENEVPEGVSEGTPVSFVAEYAQHILNIKELQKKGYDASGDNDEEISEEVEFSDDEKEAECRRLRKMEKREMMNDQKTGNTRKKKKKKQDRERFTSSYSGELTENHGSSSLSSNLSDPQMGGPVSNHQPRPQMEGFPPNGGGWRPQQNSYQLPPIPNQMVMPNLPPPMQIPLMAMQNQMMFQPQFSGGQLPMASGPGGLNFFPGQASEPWPSLVGQNCFNQQPFGMGRGIQPPQLLNELFFNLLASQGLQMQRPQSPMNPQFQMLNNNMPQFLVNPQYQVLNNNNRPQSPMNPQFQMQLQSETHPQSQAMQSPTNTQSPVQQRSQGFSTGQSSARGRGHRGRFGRGRGCGRQQSG